MAADTATPAASAATTLAIRSLRATPVLVPLADPLRTASGVIAQAPLVLLDLLTHEGVEGRAYLFAYTPLVLKPLASLLDSLAALLPGLPCAPAELERALSARFRLLGETGLVAMALAGIDMAAWDARARAAGLPLARLLGGEPRPLPSYFSRGLDDAARSVELAGRCLERGFRLMKIKAGRATLAEDLAVVRATLDALGDRARLAVDFNQSLDLPEALRRCRALDDLDLAWIEEPLAQDDWAGRARLARETRTPIMLGENWFGPDEMARCLAAGACDAAMPDLMKIGGVTGWMRAAAVARAARVPMSSHLFHEVTAHLMPLTPTAGWLEVMDLADAVLARPLRIEDGAAIAEDAPGNGLEWDADAVARHRVD